MTWPLLIACGYAPLLWWHLSGLLARPHYQFVLILPVLLVGLIRSREAETVERGDFRWAFAIGAMFLGSLGLLGLATWGWSPWIAMLSGLLTVFAIAWWNTGWNGIARWLPAWIMCWILLPPPFNSDERLTLGLRRFTTIVTSKLLDLFGILHAKYVNVIEVPQKKLFIADACSGVHSLFVLLAASLFWSLVRRRSAWHSTLLMLSTVGIVLVENIARLVLIVMGLSWRMDLTTGLDHTVLGLLLFLGSTGLIVSIDQLLLFLLPQRPSRLLAARLGSTKPSEPPRWLQFGAAVSTPLFVICGLVQWITMPGRLPDLSAPFTSVPDLRELGKDGMPATLADFSQKDYSRIERVVGDPFGQQSQQWVYTRDPLVAQISIDYPYDSFHDATVCYAEIGWQIDHVAVLAPKSQGTATEHGEKIAVVQMSRGLEGAAILMFSQIDRDGAIHARFSEQTTGSNVRDASRRFESLIKRPPTPTKLEARPPLSQIQLIARSAEPLTDADTELLLSLYAEFRERVRQELWRPSPGP